MHRLGEEYTKERITQRLIENRDNIDFEPFQPKTYRPKQYRLRTRSDRIGKVGGLYGLYLYSYYEMMKPGMEHKQKEVSKAND